MMMYQLNFDHTIDYIECQLLKRHSHVNAQKALMVFDVNIHLLIDVQQIDVKMVALVYQIDVNVQMDTRAIGAKWI
jgi:hypothetical protein